MKLIIVCHINDVDILFRSHFREVVREGSVCYEYVNVGEVREGVGEGLVYL